MPEALTKAAKSQDTEKAQDKKRRLEPALAPMKALAGETSPFAGLLGVSAMELPSETHATFLGNPRFSHSANNAQKARMVTGLQQTYGNQYVQRLVESLNVQAKLTVDSPDDQYEREADRITDAVTRASASSIQRQAEEEEEEGLVATRQTSDIQRRAEEEPEEEKEPIQMKEVGSQATEIYKDLEAGINAARGGGQPLPDSVRSSLEPQLGHDFGQVRIHTDVESNTFSQQLRAKAFTKGKDIFFKEGAYEPHSETGIKLIAHELTHVIQQTGSFPVQRQVSEGTRAVPPAKNAEPSSEEALETAEAEEAEEPEEPEEAEVPAEAIQSFPEVIYISEDLVPEESQAVKTGVMAASAGLAPTPVSHQVISPDHPSEREAEATSRTIISNREKGNRPRISSISTEVTKTIQRKLYWEKRELTWADFKGYPHGKHDAWIFTGWDKPHPPKLLKRVRRHSPTTSKQRHCTKGRPEFKAEVMIDPNKFYVKAYMLPAKSWVKHGKKSKALLRHEQGHFDIANVIAEKMHMYITRWDVTQNIHAIACGKQAALNAATKKWNALKPNKTLRWVYKEGKDLLNAANIDYELGTGQGTNAAGQKAWEKRIAGHLPSYNIPWPPQP